MSIMFKPLAREDFLAGGSRGVHRSVDTRAAVSHRPEFRQLFYAIEAAREEDRPAVLQFLAASAGEGTSTVARGFAEVAAAEYGGSVLLVDCVGAWPTPLPGLVEAWRDGRPLAGVITADRATVGLDRARLSSGENPLLDLGAGEARALFAALGERFRTVVLDCAPALACPETLALARAVDGTVLVVRAEAARRAAVLEARQRIERVGGHCIGAVMNRHRSYLPGWLDRML